MADPNDPLIHLICAASAVDAARWANEQGLARHQYRYASSASTILGMRNFTVVRLPGFFSRGDSLEIDAVIRNNEQRYRVGAPAPESKPEHG